MTVKHNEDPTDEELMTLYQSSQDQIGVQAFHVLFKRWKDRIWSYVAKKVKGIEEREDVVQKIFLKLHYSKSLYQQKYLFAQWIFTIARTTIIDHRRSQKMQPMKGEFIKNHEEVLGYSEEHSYAVDISCLSLEQQKILHLRYEEELEFKESTRELKEALLPEIL